MIRVTRNEVKGQSAQFLDAPSFTIWLYLSYFLEMFPDLHRLGRNFCKFLSRHWPSVTRPVLGKFIHPFMYDLRLYIRRLPLTFTTPRTWNLAAQIWSYLWGGSEVRRHSALSNPKFLESSTQTLSSPSKNILDLVSRARRKESQADRRILGPDLWMLIPDTSSAG